VSFDYDAAIDEMKAKARECDQQVKHLEKLRDMRFSVYWDGYRQRSHGTTAWEGLSPSSRECIRAGVEALDNLDEKRRTVAMNAQVCGPLEAAG
jgi:hypothetical protein